MRRIWILVVLLVFAVLHVAQAKGNVTLSGVVHIEFLGQSGTLRLINTADTSQEVTMSFDKIEEYTPAGKSIGNQKENLGGHGYFDWTDPQDVIVNGYKARKIETQTTLKRGAHFSVAAFVFETDAKVIHGETEYSVPKNTVKFSVKIGNWGWDAPNNTLGLTLSYKSQGKSGALDTLVKKNDAEAYVDLGSGTFTVATRALVDGKEYNFSPLLSKNGVNRQIDLRFPHFSDGVDYDPTLQLFVPESPTGAGYSITLSTILPLLVCTITMLLWL
jgi:hypothetical protein